MSIMYKSGLAPESAGILKISLWQDDFVLIENHNGIADLKPEGIKVYAKKRLLGIFGQNLSISELDGCNVKIKGKIFKIEYLT